jgi:hypothetical protein
VSWAWLRASASGSSSNASAIQQRGELHDVGLSADQRIGGIARAGEHADGSSHEAESRGDGPTLRDGGQEPTASADVLVTALWIRSVHDPSLGCRTTGPHNSGPAAACRRP